MVIVIQNFAKTDCKYYEVRDIPSCCGRKQKAGVCAISYKGVSNSKTCSTKMKWCNYTKEENTECSY